MSSQIELLPGTNRDLGLSQWFTPPELASRVVEWALAGGDDDSWHRSDVPKRTMHVLEPSAGNGSLVRPLMAAGAYVAAVEIDVRYAAGLMEMANDCIIGDFLKIARTSEWRFDLAVMNPPYEDGADVEFILHALNFAPRVVGIFQAGIEYGVDRYNDLWSLVQPTRVMKLRRRWFKDPLTKGSGVTNYVVMELQKRTPCSAGCAYPHVFEPDHVTLEWW